MDLPLLGVVQLLQQPIPDDLTTATDFDLYQYMMYRHVTRFAEFGGSVHVLYTVSCPFLMRLYWQV